MLTTYQIGDLVQIGPQHAVITSIIGRSARLNTGVRFNLDNPEVDGWCPIRKQVGSSLSLLEVVDAG